MRHSEMNRGRSNMRENKIEVKVIVGVVKQLKEALSINALRA